MNDHMEKTSLADYLRNMQKKGLSIRFRNEMLDPEDLSAICAEEGGTYMGEYIFDKRGVAVEINIEYVPDKE